MKDKHLAQILLPFFDNAGTALDRSNFTKVSAELTRQFGGATSFLRSPADGVWKKGRRTDRDQVVVVETMVSRVDLRWWRAYP